VALEGVKVLKWHFAKFKVLRWHGTNFDLGFCFVGEKEIEINIGTVKTKKEKSKRY
jgi:hypothetical protein